MEKRVHKLTFYHPKLERISECFNSCYIVGGFVRDRLLGIRKEFTDIDLVTSDDLERVVKCIGERLKRKPFSFEREKRVFSFVGDYFRIDVSNIFGESIEEDLRRRDFTINAIGVDFRELFLPFNDDVLLIDPTGGFEDLKKGLIRPAYENSISDDPVRIVRGVRFKVLLDFRYHSSFIEQSKGKERELSESPVERVREELLKILRSKKFSTALRDFDSLEVLYGIFGELSGIEKVPPSGLHQYNLKEHTLKTVELLEGYVFKKAGEILGELSTSLGSIELIPNFSDRECLKLTALYHDVGKPLTVKEINGRLTFYNHDKVGAEITKGALLRLGFGKKAGRMGFIVVRNHLRPFFLYDLYRKGKLSERAIYRLFRDTREYFLHTLLLSVADFGATSEEMFKKLPEYEEFVKYLLQFYRERLLNLKPLLSGREIMEIKRYDRPNRCVGIIKEKLLELQAVGKVKTKDEAISVVLGMNCEDKV
jgi:poly(A) polymerase